MKMTGEPRYVKQRQVVPVSNEAPRLVGTCELGNMYHYWAKANGHISDLAAFLWEKRPVTIWI